MDAQESTSTRPYLLRALYEWCTDNGFTPYIAVLVDDTVRVPMEYVKDGEIVLNISFDATSALKLGNDYIEFKGRFGGVARDILVPVDRVLAIYARENGQGMAFPTLATGAGSDPAATLPKSDSKKRPKAAKGAVADTDADPVPPGGHTVPGANVRGLTSVASGAERPSGATDDTEPPKPPAAGARPSLTRIK